MIKASHIVLAATIIAGIVLGLSGANLFYLIGSLCFLIGTFINMVRP